MFKKTFAQWAINGAPDIHHGMMVVKDVNAFLFAKIYWLGKSLLFPVHLWIVAPHNKITLPIHAEGVND